MRLVLITLPACLLLTAAPVHAEKPSAPEPSPHVAVRLSFKTIDGCPGERAFRAEVASWVGYDPFSPEGVDLITIWFERAGPLFSGSFTLTTSDQTRASIGNSKRHARACFAPWGSASASLSPRPMGRRLWSPLRRPSLLLSVLRLRS